MPENRWYVVTGAPSSGKTTLLGLLAAQGFRVTEEAARVLIDRERIAGRTTEEIRADERAFQRRVLEEKIAIERCLSRDETIFFDRGIPDSVAYYEAQGMLPDAALDRALAEASYAAAFVLDLCPYDPDYARTESEEERRTLDRRLEKTYRDMSIPVVRVPLVPPPDRLTFVLQSLKERRFF